MQNIVGKVLLIIVIILITLFVYKTVKTPVTAPTSVTIIEQESSNKAHEEEKVQLIIKDYLMNNPEIIIQAVEQYQKRKMQEMGAKVNDYIKNNKSEIENPTSSPILGNEKGDIIIVFFYDYNCSYCKKGNLFLNQLVKTDPNVKIILKPFSILSDSSNYAARIAYAVYKLDPNKFSAIHEGLMQMNPIDKESVEKLLVENDLNIEAIEEEFDKEGSKNPLIKNNELAQNLKIQGVPAYIINSRLVPGLMDLAQLQNMIADIRSQSKENTK